MKIRDSAWARVRLVVTPVAGARYLDGQLGKALVFPQDADMPLQSETGSDAGSGRARGDGVDMDGRHTGRPVKCSCALRSGFAGSFSPARRQLHSAEFQFAKLVVTL